MPDIIDDATELAERQLSESLARARAAAGESLTPAPTGYCMNTHCAEDLTDGRVFCGPECAREFERLEKRNG